MMIWETRVISRFWSKTKVGQLEKKIIFDFFFELKFMKTKDIYECSSTLENFLVKHVHISIFFS